MDTRPLMIHKAMGEGRAACNFWSRLRGIGKSPRFQKWVTSRFWSKVTCARCLKKRVK